MSPGIFDINKEFGSMLKPWQVLENINRPRVYFFVVLIFSLVCLRFVVVWWNVCSALSLDKWWSLGVNSRVSQLQGIPAVFWDSICVYISFFLLYFLLFFFLLSFWDWTIWRLWFGSRLFKYYQLFILYYHHKKKKKNDEGTATSEKWNIEIYI